MKAPVAILLAVLTLLTAPPALADPVTVEVSGATHGMLRLAVFADAKAFAARAPAIAAKNVAPVNGGADVAFDLPPGRYAVAVYQDADGDGQLDTNFIGLPTEPYGFSGKPARFGPPGFDGAAFAVPAVDTVRIDLQGF